MYDQIEGADTVEDDAGVSEKDYYTAATISLWTFAALILCCVVFNWKNIKIGVAVMKATAQFVATTPQIFLVPLIAIVLLLIWFFVWIFVWATIASVGTLKPREDFPFLTTVEWKDETL